MPVNHLLLLLFLLNVKTGFSAEISVFVQTGASVQLDIQTQELPKTLVFMWQKDKSATIVTCVDGTKVKPESSYEKRVKFNSETFSMTLKNMTETDSGLYTAKSIEDNNKFFAEYRVSVIDTVEAPVLTVNSNWSVSNFCTVNFTCRAHDLILSSMYSGNCSQKEVQSNGNNNLTLDCSQKSIICNHSNPVSWKEDRINITQLCVNKEKTTQKKESSLLWPGIGVAGVLVFIVAVFPVYRKYKKGGQMEVVQDSTVYAHVEAQEMQKLSDCHTYDIPERVQAETQKETGDKQPETTYCTVGQHQKPTITPEKDHTIYATVCKLPTKDPPANSPDDTLK